MPTISKATFNIWVNDFINLYINKESNLCEFEAQAPMLDIYNEIAHSFKKQMNDFYTEWPQVEFPNITRFIDHFFNGKEIYTIASGGSTPYTCDLSNITGPLKEYLTAQINTYQKQAVDVRAIEGADFGNTPFSYQPLTCNGPCAALLSDLLSWMDRVHDSFGARKSSESTPVQELEAQRYVWEVVFLGIKKKYDKITLDAENKREVAAHKTLQILFNKLVEIIYDNGIPVYENLNDYNIKSILATTVDNPKCIFHYCSIISFVAYHSAINAIEQGILISAKFGKTPYEMLHELQTQENFTLMAESRDKGHGETLLLLKTPVNFLIQIMGYMYKASQEEDGYIIISDFWQNRQQPPPKKKIEGRRQVKVPDWRLLGAMTRGQLESKKLNLKNIRYRSFKYTMPTTVSKARIDVTNIDISTQLQRLKAIRGGDVEVTADVATKPVEKYFPRDYFNLEGIELKAVDLATQPCQLSIDMHSGGNVGHNTFGMDPALSSVMPFDMTPLIGPTNTFGQAMASNAYCNDPAGDVYKGGFADTIKLEMRNLVSFENRSKLPMDLKKSSKNQTPDFLSNATNHFTKLGVYAPYAEYTHTMDGNSGVEMPYKMGFKLKMNYEYEDINILLALLSSNPDKLNILKGITEKKCGNGKKIPRGNCSHKVECSCLRQHSRDIKQDFQSYMDCWSGKNGKFLFETSGNLINDKDKVIRIYNTNAELDYILSEHTSPDNKPIPPILKIKISANGQTVTVNYNHFWVEEKGKTGDASTGSSEEESVDTSSEEAENHGYLLLQFDSDDNIVSIVGEKNLNVEVVQPMTATMIKDHKQAKVNWCPCHGAFINNFVDIVEQSEDLTEYIRENMVGDWPKFLRNIAQEEEAATDTWEENTNISYDVPQDKSELMTRARTLGLSTKGKKLELANSILKWQKENTPEPTISIVDANNIFLKTEKNISETLKEFANNSSVNGVSFQRHLKASGTIGDSNAFNLDNIAEDGMGICNKSCACKGLCLGNKIWAAFGLNILYIMEKTKAGKSVEDMIKNELQNSNSIIVMPFFALINIIFQDGQTDSDHIIKELTSISKDYLGPNDLERQGHPALQGLVLILLKTLRGSIQMPMVTQFHNLRDRINIFEKSELTFPVSNIDKDNIQVNIAGIIVTIPIQELEEDDGSGVPSSASVGGGDNKVIPGNIIVYINDLIQKKHSHLDTFKKYFGEEKLTPVFIDKIKQLNSKFELLDDEYNNLLSEEKEFEEKLGVGPGANPMLLYKNIFFKTLANRKSTIENVVGGYSSKATEYAVIDGSAVLHANLEEEFNETLKNWWRMYVPGNRVIARFPEYENFYPGVITEINDEDVSITFDETFNEGDKKETRGVQFDKIHTMPVNPDGSDDVNVSLSTGWKEVTDKKVKTFPKKKYGYPRPKDIAKFIRENKKRTTSDDVNVSLSSESSEDDNLEDSSQDPVDIAEVADLDEQPGGLDIESFNDMMPYIWFLMKTIAFDVNNNPIKILHETDRFNPDNINEYEIDLATKMYLIGEQGAANLRNIIYTIQHWRPKRRKKEDKSDETVATEESEEESGKEGEKKKPDEWRYLYTPKQIVFAKKRLIMAITAVKTGGDLHQLTLPLQNKEEKDKLAPALMLEGTGDFMGTGFQVMFQIKDNKMPQPRTFLTKRAGGIGFKLPMICIEPEIPLLKYKFPQNQEEDKVNLKGIKDNIDHFFFKGTPSESVADTAMSVGDTVSHMQQESDAFDKSGEEQTSTILLDLKNRYTELLDKFNNQYGQDGTMDKKALREQLGHFFQEATNLSEKLNDIAELLFPDQTEQAKLLNKEIEEFINHLSKLKAQNTVLAMETGGSKSKKRYHRRRSTIRKKKRRKAKSIKRRRKRGRKTRKNKIN